ncbi:MAG: hypothetical protein JRI61_11905 [Deltaproteobacteria bacterium]|nr:hypothetical protein [Deltaproteobacteria bacterium]
MGTSLKDALEKAGLKPSKRENERKRKPRGSGKPKAIEKHQQQRSFCDCCEKTAPDVEFYKHNNPSIQAKWLCIVCADKHSIPDDTRQSNQSDFAMRGTFRRRYGRTKKFPKTGHPE